MADTVITKTVNLGRLPVYCGTWSSAFNGGNGYHLYNKVTYYGSEFINQVEGNKLAPATIQTDNEGRWTGYTVNTGWNMAANSYDASIFAVTITNYVQETTHKASLVFLSLIDNTTGANHTAYGCAFYGDSYTLTYTMVINTYSGTVPSGTGYPKYFSDAAYTTQIPAAHSGVTNDLTTYGQTKPKDGTITMGTAASPISHTIRFYNKIKYGIAASASVVASSGTNWTYPTSAATGKTYTSTNSTGAANKFYLLCPTGTHGVTVPTKFTMNGYGVEIETSTITSGGITYSVVATQAPIAAGKAVSIYAS